MNFTHRTQLILTIVLLVLITGPVSSQTNASGRKSTHTFGWQGEHFLLDGKPFQIISGDMHYARVPRQYWRDRMKKMKAMGLNTLTTYVFWNLHEPIPGQFDFTGNLDLAEYVRTAQEEGLWVIVRPGPYVCSEWDFGGLPPWLLATPDIKVRSADPRFLQAAGQYMQRVGQQLAPLQITRGGPVIMVQVENEYGSFGKDKVYLNAVRQMISNAGFDVTRARHHTATLDNPVLMFLATCLFCLVPYRTIDLLLEKITRSCCSCGTTSQRSRRSRGSILNHSGSWRRLFRRSSRSWGRPVVFT